MAILKLLLLLAFSSLLISHNGVNGTKSELKQARADVLEAIGLVNLRLAMADKVAKYKVPLGKPINDPEREDDVMKVVLELAKNEGVDEVYAKIFFTDQMEANKIVQEALKAQETDLAKMKAVDKNDFESQVRGTITELNAKLVDAIGKVARSQSPDCLKLAIEEVKKKARELAKPNNKLEVPVVEAAREHALARALNGLCYHQKHQEKHQNDEKPHEEKPIEKKPNEEKQEKKVEEKHEEVKTEA